MYRKKGRGWTKHIDFMLIDIACIVIAFFISYVIRFGFNNPYVDKDYRIISCHSHGKYAHRNIINVFISDVNS